MTVNTLESGAGGGPGTPPRGCFEAGVLVDLGTLVSTRRSSAKLNIFPIRKTISALFFCVTKTLSSSEKNALKRDRSSILNPKTEPSGEYWPIIQCEQEAVNGDFVEGVIFIVTTVVK